MKKHILFLSSLILSTNLYTSSLKVFADGLVAGYSLSGALENSNKSKIKELSLKDKLQKIALGTLNLLNTGIAVRSACDDLNLRSEKINLKDLGKLGCLYVLVSWGKQIRESFNDCKWEKVLAPTAILASYAYRKGEFDNL